MSIDLNKSVKLVGGLVDLEATLKAYADEIVTYNATKANDLEVVGVAVNTVFDQYKGAAIAADLVSFAMGELTGVTLENDATLRERTNDFIDGAVLSGVLAMKKGKHGGFSRVADAPVKA